MASSSPVCNQRLGDKQTTFDNRRTADSEPPGRCGGRPGSGLIILWDPRCCPIVDWNRSQNHPRQRCWLVARCASVVQPMPDQRAATKPAAKSAGSPGGCVRNICVITSRALAKCPVSLREKEMHHLIDQTICFSHAIDALLHG